MFCIILCAIQNQMASTGFFFKYMYLIPQPIHEASFPSWEKDMMMMMTELNCLKIIHVKKQSAANWQNLFAPLPVF